MQKTEYYSSFGKGGISAAFLVCGAEVAELSLLASRKSLQAEKALEKDEESPTMSVEMYGRTPGVA